MTMPPTEPIVDKTGHPTVPFQREREDQRNGILVCTAADLPTIKPVPGWTRFVVDLGKPVWGNGEQWVDATGTPV